MHIPQYIKNKGFWGVFNHWKYRNNTEMVALEHACLVSILLCCDGNKLLGGFGDVISTLDDLLGDKLHVRPWAAVQRHGFPALVL